MSSSPRPHPARLRTLAVVLALAPFLAIACGSDDGGVATAGPDAGDAGGVEGGAGDGSGSAGESAGSGVGAGGFCAEVADIEADLALLRDTTVPDPAAYPDLIGRVEARFADVAPPAEVASSWQRVHEFLTFARGAFDGVEVRTQQDLSDALNARGEEAFGMVLTLPGQVELVGAYIQDECDIDLGITPPVVYDACPLVDEVHLTSVFTAAVPEGRAMPWGAGLVECTWEDGDDEVGLVVAPAPVVGEDLIGGMTPIETSNVGDVVVEVYDGAIGPFRSQGGRTAVTVVGDVGLAVSVATGDRAAEQSKAVALVSMVALELP